MMRGFSSTLILVAAAAVLADTSSSYGQPMPFDMSEELRAPEPRTMPLGLSPNGALLSEADSGSERARRHFLPRGEQRLAGEMATRSWTVSLGPGATEKAHLHLGYQNSVMVAPEVSRLKVTVNGTVLGESPIRSPDGVTDMVLPIPAGLLTTGQNRISMEVTQRHRTDCTVDSTYELWTDLDPRRTFISQETGGEPSISTLDDVATVGMNGSGQTEIAVVAPSLDDPIVAESMLILAQKLAILTDAPHLTFSIGRTLEGIADDSALTLIVGTTSDFKALDLQIPEGAGMTALKGLPDRAEARTVLAVGGSTANALREMLKNWTIASGGASDASGKIWPGTDVPLIASGGSISFDELGIPTERFSGRRYTRQFDIAVPTDFYAQSYGEAKIMMDAALSREVRPGSRIDIYVNDRIASTMPIMDSGGGVLRQLPIRVGLQDVRPGPNRIRLEAVMVTEADKACEPGTTASDTPRFAIYETSRLVMPQFARIAQRPDLAAFATGGLAETLDNEPMQVVLEPRSEHTLAAAMNLTGRMAASSGGTVPIELLTPGESIEDKTALIVAPVTHLTGPIRDRVRIASPEDNGWASEKTVQLSLNRERVNELEEWRESLETSPVRRQISEIAHTLQENFDLSLAALRLVPGQAEEFHPDKNDTVVLAQAVSPEGGGTWTVVAAPNPEALLQGTADLAERSTWAQVGGRLSVYSAAPGSVTNLPPVAVELVPTQPWSLANARLIATNWMSTNALAYSLLLAIACIFLGAVTLALLSQLGRRS